MDHLTADERVMLARVLDAQREDIAALLDDVDDTEARRRLVPSLTTPLSLVRHATFVERVWFHHRVAGVPREELDLPEDASDSFVLTPEDTVASVRAGYLAACARSREIAEGRDLDEEFDWRGRPATLRYVYVHMIQELAHHAGHGDILVEQLLAARG